MPIKIFSLPPQGAAKFIEPFQKVVREFPHTTMNLASPEILSFHYKNWIENIVPKLVKKYSLNFNHRNTPFKTILGLIPSRSESSLHTLREAGSVSLDISALWKSHEDAMRAIQFLGEKLRHVYLSNVHRNVPYSPLSTGVLPVESFLTKLKRNNYRGDFTLKISPENLREGDDERMLEIIRASKEFFEKYFTNVGEQ